MDDRIRFLLMAAITVLVSISFIALSVSLYLSGKLLSSLPILILIGALVVIAISAVFLKDARSGLKRGLPSEDERTVRAKIRAGYYTFLISIYILLGMMFYTGTGADMGLPQIEARVMFGLAILSMAAIFMPLFKEGRFMKNERKSEIIRLALVGMAVSLLFWGRGDPASITISVNITAIIVVMSFFRRRYPEKYIRDERTKKLGAYAVSWSWQLSYMLVAVLILADYLGYFSMPAGALLGVIFFFMTATMLIFRWYFLRKEDIEGMP